MIERSLKYVGGKDLGLPFRHRRHGCRLAPARTPRSAFSPLAPKVFASKKPEPENPIQDYIKEITGEKKSKKKDKKKKKNKKK